MFQSLGIFSREAGAAVLCAGQSDVVQSGTFLRAVSNGKMLFQTWAVSFSSCLMENEWVYQEHLHCAFLLY